MNSTEIRLYATALLYCKRYDDCCPDGGMGPSLGTLLERVENLSGVPLSPAERNKIIAKAELLENPEPKPRPQPPEPRKPIGWPDFSDDDDQGMW